MANLLAAGVDGERLFASASAWFGGMVVGGHYLGPLTGCLSPRFWCVPATTRGTATLLYSLGLDMNGYRRAPMEPMQLLASVGPTESTDQSELPPHSCGRAIHWWAFRLNQMFDYLSDPSTFADHAGKYDPHAHQHWVLTFHQVFGLMTAIQTASRDRTTQVALMYTLLDTFADRVTGRSFEDLCTLRRAKKVAQRVSGRMSPDASKVLMPTVDRSIAALESLQAGFFIQHQRREKLITLYPPNQQSVQMSPEKAVAQLLKLFRNATHGFGGRSNSRTNDQLLASLLVHHDGDLPDGIVMLPFLYLLEALSYPDIIRKRIARSVRSS